MNKEYLDETIEVGDKIISLLNDACDSLGTAEDWGVFSLLGGGLVPTAGKFSEINKTKQILNKTNQLIEVFHKRLKKINLESDIEVNIGAFDFVLDLFLDSILIDMLIQFKIDDTLEKIYAALATMREIMEELEALNEK